MGSRWWLLVLWALSSCASDGVRAYYAPLEVELAADAPENPIHVDEREGTIFRIRCQGSYLNRVDGETRRTVHMQLELTRSRDGAVNISRRDLRLRLVDAEGRTLDELLPAEIWQADERVFGPLEVLPWRRAAFDLFFDAPPEEGEQPPLLRFSWRWRDDGPGGYGDCSFRLLPDDAPTLPERLSGPALSFGFARGYYMPGWGDLGRRRLRPSTEARQHHVFHAPSAWWP